MATKKADHMISGETSNEELVRINFEVSIELRNAFKAKVASQGKKVKDVLVSLMTNYLNEN
ncbi:MAG: plasmid partition protein ParG [Gammaproteobacteria bacterium]